MIHKAYLSAGTNLGDRESNLRLAISQLNRLGVMIRQISSCFETEPVGFHDQPWFLNVAMEVHTALSPAQLLDHCQAIEQAHGRVRTFENAPRTIDIDILLYDDLVISTPRLTIPHPRMAERRFVLVPLAEIAPDVIHPVLRRTARSLLETCPDQSEVRPSAASILLI